MPKFTPKHLIRWSKQIGKRLYGAKIAVMGLAYKKNINDPWESPAIKTVGELAGPSAGVRISEIGIH